MNILATLSSNNRRPINNSLKKVCLAIAYANKDKKLKIFGLVEELKKDLSYEQLKSQEVKILTLSGKNLIQKIFKIRNIISEKKIDIIQCAGFKQLIFFYLAIFNMNTSPCIVMTDRTTDRWNGKFSTFLSKFILFFIRPYIHVLNTRHFNYLKSKKYLFKDIVMIPNGVELFIENSKKITDLKKDSFNVCYIKSIREDTGHEDIINLASLIKFSGIKILIHLIGEGSLYQDFLKKVSKLELEEVIKTYGELEHSKALFILRKMNLGITTSPIEMMPNFVLECFSVGVPIIGYKTAGVEDLIVDNKNGYLIEPGDIKAFFEKIVYLSKENSKLQELSKNSLKSASKYSVSNIGNELIKFYKRILV